MPQYFKLTLLLNWLAEKEYRLLLYKFGAIIRWEQYLLLGIYLANKVAIQNSCTFKILICSGSHSLTSIKY